MSSNPVLTGVMTLGLGLGISGGAAAQDYPTQPITFVVGFSAGGFADTMGRILAQGMSERLGQPIAVENQGGAGGNIAAAQVASAEADGYTVLVTTASLALSQALEEPIEYELADLTPVAIAVSSPEVLAANPSVPATNLAELLEWARTQDAVTLGSAGVGTSSQIVTSYFLKNLAGLDNVVEVTYRGGGPANQAAISGEVNLVGSSNSAYPFIREGLLNGLAVAAEEQHDAIPGVQTYAEQGFDGLEASSWVGLFVPAGTDPEIQQTLNDAANAVLDDPEAVEQLENAGVRIHRRDLGETARFLQSDIESWTNMVESTGIKAE